MSNIKCKNCGKVSVFSASERCKCNIKLYGYNINTLPDVYKNILSPSSYSSEIKSNKPISSPSSNASGNKVGWFVTHTEGKKKEVGRKEGKMKEGRKGEGGKEGKKERREERKEGGKVEGKKKEIGRK